MLKLNLLPWREEAQHYASRKFKLQLLLALFMGISILLIWRGLLSYEIQHLKTQQKVMQQTLAQLAPQVTAITQLKNQQRALAAALKAKKKIAAQQAKFLQLLNDLSRCTPTIMLTQLQKNNAAIMLQGKSKTSSAITQLLQELTRLAYISPPKLLNHTLENNFTVSFQLQ